MRPLPPADIVLGNLQLTGQPPVAAPHPGDVPMMAREAFGPYLQHERERVGLTLESIAATTKISRVLLDGLEHNDLSRWPRGIARRSFFRSYVTALGLPVESTLSEFVRLFPEPGQEVAPDDRPPLRVSLVPESRWKARGRQCLAAALDSGAVLLAGYGIAAWSDGSLWMTTAAVALSYQAANTIVLGQSFSAWCLSGAFVRRLTRSSTIAGQVAALRQDWLADVPESAIRDRA